jgi:hypothetical protein
MTIKYGLHFFFELTDNDGQNILAGIVLTYSHHFDVFLCGAATINFTFSFYAYFDYNHLE